MELQSRSRKKRKTEKTNKHKTFYLEKVATSTTEKTAATTKVDLDEDAREKHYV